MGIALPPAVARGRGAHESCVETVVEIADEHAVFDQDVALAGSPLVIDIDRTAPFGEGAVVDHGDAFGRHAFAQGGPRRPRSSCG